MSPVLETKDYDDSEHKCRRCISSDDENYFCDTIGHDNNASRRFRAHRNYVDGILIYLTEFQVDLDRLT